MNRLSQIVNDLTKSEFSKRTVNDVVSGDRTEIMATIFVKSLNKEYFAPITLISFLLCVGYYLQYFESPN